MAIKCVVTHERIKLVGMPLGMDEATRNKSPAPTSVRASGSEHRMPHFQSWAAVQSAAFEDDAFSVTSLATRAVTH